MGIYTYTGNLTNTQCNDAGVLNQRFSDINSSISGTAFYIPKFASGGAGLIDSIMSEVNTGTVNVAGNITVEQDINGQRFYIASVSDALAVTAGASIPVTDYIMHVEGDGAPVDITADPQIASGTTGQILIMEGKSDTNYITLNDDNGLHLHGRAVLKDDDMLLLYWNGTKWEEVTRNFPESEKTFGFNSPAGGSGTLYAGGFYILNSGNDNFNPATTFGTANISYAAHFFVVTAGGDAAGDTTLTITGTSIDDQGNRTAADTQTITIEQNEAANTYHETTKKWLGQISIEKTAGNDVECNYGFCKYWDNNNNNFVVRGIEVTGRAGANDANPNFSLIHHKATGWTYNAGAEPTPPTALVNMNTDHNTEIQFSNGENFAWKRDNLDTSISGGDDEGLIFRYTTTANRAVDQANVLYRVRPQ
jgi:hypothetical protein